MTITEFISKAEAMFQSKSGEIYVTNFNHYYDGICMEKDNSIGGYTVYAFREKGLIRRVTYKVLMCCMDCMDWMESPRDRAFKLLEKATQVNIEFNIE